MTPSPQFRCGNGCVWVFGALRIQSREEERGGLRPAICGVFFLNGTGVIRLPIWGGSNNANVLGCPRKLGSMVSKWVITYSYNGVYLGYNPLTNLLLTSCCILVW